MSIAGRVRARVERWLGPGKATAACYRRQGVRIDKGGCSPDPRSAEIFQAMEEPVNGKDLAAVLGILRWMAPAIPDLARIILPLNDQCRLNVCKFTLESSRRIG